MRIAAIYENIQSIIEIMLIYICDYTSDNFLEKKNIYLYLYIIHIVVEVEANLHLQYLI